MLKLGSCGMWYTPSNVFVFFHPFSQIDIKKTSCLLSTIYIYSKSKIVLSWCPTNPKRFWRKLYHERFNKFLRFYSIIFHGFYGHNPNSHTSHAYFLLVLDILCNIQILCALWILFDGWPQLDSNLDSPNKTTGPKLTNLSTDSITNLTSSAGFKSKCNSR